MTRFVVYALSAILLLPIYSWAAITENVMEGGNTGGSDETTLTVAVTVAAGSNTSMYVCVADSLGDQSTLTGVTWNTSEALTSIASVDMDDLHKAQLYRLKAPTTGTHDVVVTAPTSRRLAAAVIVLDGVDQTTSERSASTNENGEGTTPTVTVAASQSGDYILDCVARGQLEDDTATAGAGQTSLIQSRANGFNDVGVVTSKETASGASTVMDWTLSNTRYSASIGVPIIAAGGGGGGGTETFGLRRRVSQ